MENVIQLLRKKLAECEKRFVNNSIIVSRTVSGPIPDTSFDLEMIIKLREAIHVLNASCNDIMLENANANDIVLENADLSYDVLEMDPKTGAGVARITNNVTALYRDHAFDLIVLSNTSL